MYVFALVGCSITVSVRQSVSWLQCRLVGCSVGWLQCWLVAVLVAVDIIRRLPCSLVAVSVVGRVDWLVG